MPQLLVHDVDEALIKALHERAARHGRTAEAEHRDILARALRPRRRRTLAQALAAIPNVGADQDFKRIDN